MNEKNPHTEGIKQDIANMLVMLGSFESLSETKDWSGRLAWLRLMKSRACNILSCLGDAESYEARNLAEVCREPTP